MGEPAGTDDNATARVELAQYAWVTAALAEGFGLDEVLGLEGLEPEHWTRAELSWRTRLATELDIHDDYRAHLAEAEDELGGQVTPLADDLEAWVVFLRLYGDHPAPFELLAEQKLRPGDLARLHRRWARRLEADEDLVERAEDLREKVAARAQDEDGDKLSLPAITVAPGSLSASPHARVRPAEPDEAGAPVEQLSAPSSARGAPDLSLYDYAALCAALDDEGVDEEAVLRAFGFTLEEGKRLERVWRTRMDADPALASDFRTLHRHFNEREGIRAEAPASQGPAAAWRPPDPLPHAPHVLPAPSAPVASPPPTPAPAPIAPKKLGYNPQLGMTMQGAEPHAHSRVVLPFGAKRGSDSSPGAPPPREPAARKKLGYNPALGMTAKVGQKVPHITLPFRAQQLRDIARGAAKGAKPAATKPSEEPPSTPSSPPASSSAPAAPKKKLGYNPELAMTAKVDQKVPLLTLPFQAIRGPDSSQRAGQDDLPDHVAAELDARNPVPRGFASPARRRGGEPSPSEPSEPVQDDESSRAAGGESQVDSGDLDELVAGWKVNHYASFCAELAEYPDSAAAIRVRYGLSDEAAEHYVHELWQLRFVEDAEARRQWQRLLQLYRRSLAQSK